ncbi:MAG: tryptophan 2,3-dioxygenase family protein [Bacteroidia bacterium]|nr:tryptophan 2,3-dioxygenase family protein [Bacteroidia bacterium]
MNSEWLTKLSEKYSQTGQDIDAYLQGLLLSNYLNYWDYIHLDTLLTLQKPKTDFPDEKIFIIYHQITELYFNLCLHEIHQIANNGLDILPNGKNNGWKKELDPDFFLSRVHRINRYFIALTTSFDIMVDGMDKEQFTLFRMALLPASGFQSAQYRKIELGCTDLINLTDKTVRPELVNKQDNPELLLNHIYWKQGATEVATGKKTYTLIQFEKKYMAEFLELAKEYQNKNIWRKYCSLPEKARLRDDIKQALRMLDVQVNVNWPLVHYKSAVRYLTENGKDVAATGGTNWQKYLPPRFQKRMFFPDLWTEQEKEEWGKSWVDTHVFLKK